MVERAELVEGRYGSGAGTEPEVGEQPGRPERAPEQAAGGSGRPWPQDGSSTRNRLHAREQDKLSSSPLIGADLALAEVTVESPVPFSRP